MWWKGAELPEQHGNNKQYSLALLPCCLTSPQTSVSQRRVTMLSLFRLPRVFTINQVPKVSCNFFSSHFSFPWIADGGGWRLCFFGLVLLCFEKCFTHTSQDPTLPKNMNKQPSCFDHVKFIVYLLTRLTLDLTGRWLSPAMQVKASITESITESLSVV